MLQQVLQNVKSKFSDSRKTKENKKSEGGKMRIIHTEWTKLKHNRTSKHCHAN